MQKRLVTLLDVSFKVEDIWMNVANPALSMEAAVMKLKALGNQIAEVDEVGRRVRIVDVPAQNPTIEVWACDKCQRAQSQSYAVVEAHEKTCEG